MQRFAIKIDKSVKARLKNLCRLCGMEHPNQIEILNAAEWIDLTIEGEVTLSRKIGDCVGIQVIKNDRMPQRICAMCLDKINDFYEFREMCQATNVQTRNLLNIPEPKVPKKVPIKSEEQDVESIFGIEGTDIKPKAEPTQKPTKKSKRTPAPATTTVATNENRFRGMTKREIEITLELERIKKEEEEEKQAQLIETRTKNGKRKKPTPKATTDGMLLAPKEPNQRERKREIEQKRIEKKRKPEVKIKAPLKKKIKKEPGVLCAICDARFDKASLRDAHLVVHHRPATSSYGCSSCMEPIQSKAECDAHFEWHQMFNIPFKCVLCEATFEKPVTFQRHISACTHPSFSLLNSFTDNIYCKRCKQEYATQYLYDWHSCFMSDNSACPHCDRVFIKRSVLIKHFFRCDGTQSTAEPPRKVTAKTKKSKSSSFGKGKDIAPQNSFKHEPETIIETADEPYDAIDDSYMDVHFGDSDNDEFDATDSIMTTAEISIQNNVVSNATVKLENRAASSSLTAKKSTTCLTSKPSIQTNLSQPLLECCVKLEPIDLSSFTTTSGSINVAQIEKRTATVPPLVISRPTVPPLTIRIKKEVIQPGYGDAFDSTLAQNIKQERVDETWELASTSKCAKPNEYSSSNKKSKHRNKVKKLYKKPAMLAIKIKQERIEREENDSEYYQDYPLPNDDFTGHTVSQTFDNNPLPIITQIHSVLEPSSSIPLTIDSGLVNASINSVPFVPIRIKTEFQKPLTPPPPPADQPINDMMVNEHDEVTSSLKPVDEMQILNPPNENDEIGNNPASVDQTQNEISTNEYDKIENNQASVDQTQNEIPSNEYDKIENNPASVDQTQNEIPTNENAEAVEPETCKNANEQQNNECSTNVESSENNGSKLQISPTIDQNLDELEATSLSQSIVESSDEIGLQKKDEITADAEIVLPSTNGSNIDSATPQDDQDNTDADKVLPQDETQSCDEIALSTNEIIPCQNEVASDENQTTPDDEETMGPLENPSSQENANVETLIDIDVNADPNVQHSVDQIEMKDSSSDNQLIDEGEDKVAKPSYGHVLDAVANENMSPIEFNYTTLNDDSLNFIDQLVHEVADTMVSHIDTLETNENVATNPLNSSRNLHEPIVNTMQFNATDYVVVNNVDCTDETIVKVAETSSELASGVVENSTDDVILALSDIPEINYSDMLPALNASEHKPNGNEVNASSSIQTDRDADIEIAKLMDEHVTSDGVEPILPLNEIDYEQS